ncbi:unnamed protein product [Penicillium nalgiovense]|uniref:Squalene cyclase N-terminal domain-containing protein n=1 Tax=Penicillium nalgiovense TaxID=60175 RepID=A0A9W4IJH0_PENNA|nr:unnamed protein product [Penicillium nalgiovense]CAG7970758.1 unnamed protein product [Penicillium nalgiovense]CAG7971034.1 unnamed protein product [Penicillium nalgiovense]CAG7973716.1 unnamed protein product [Penicillium nalgiovense]CAG7974141.1 unnamed protein product [Penicillium nalgiovense]
MSQAQKTDYTRWRMLDEDGKHTWHYLDDDEAVAKWPQTLADKYYLGLPLGLPELPPATSPLESVSNCLTFFSKQQLPPGNWGCEYGGPMFLLPGDVIAWMVTDTHIPPVYAAEIINYLVSHANPVDGGWGLHTEGDSTVFGTSLNYTVLRLLGVEAEHPVMVQARRLLHRLGGALNAPHWSKFWLAVLGVCDWEIVNPIPPEAWLLPDWVPLAPWRWWVHIRQVFLPMSWIWSKRWTAPETDVIRALRRELFVQSWESVDWAAHRNNIAPTDNYHPKTLARRAEDWVSKLVDIEDANSDYADLASVNAPMNLLVCYIRDGPDSYSVRRHRERMEEFLWVNKEGMFVNGTNGVQCWDTAFLIQAVSAAGLAEDVK